MKSIIFSNSATVAVDEVEKREIPIHLPVHLRVQQRKARKCITIVEGLAKDLDLKKMAKAIRQTHNTSCSVVTDKKTKESVLQIAGDHRVHLMEFLTMTHICDKKQIKIHGA